MDSAADLVSHAIASARAAGAYQADAALSESESFESRVRGSEIDFVKQSRERGLGIRVFYGGRWGLSTASTRTSDLSRDVIARTAADAVALARATAADACAGLPDGGFAGELPDLELFEPRDRPFEPATRIAAARARRSPRRTRSTRASATPRARRSTRRTARSSTATARASSASTRRRATRWSPSHSRSGESGMQRDAWFSSSRRWDGLEPADSDRPARGRARAAQAGRAQGADLRGAGDLRPGHRAEPRCAQLAGCASGYAIYRGASFLAGKLGLAVASPEVTIIDDPLRKGGLGSRPFDGEGLPSRRNVLVANGRLASYVLDTYSARKLGLRSTAQRRALRRRDDHEPVARAGHAHARGADREHEARALRDRARSARASTR